MSDAMATGRDFAGRDQINSTAEEDAHAILANSVSWGAIFAGVVVGLVAQVLMTLLGVGIGAATLDPSGGNSPDATTFSVATGLWYVIAGVIAAFIGGYVAARMSGKTAATTGALHGLTAWAFTTLLVIFMLMSAVGGVVGGALGGVTNLIGGAGRTVAETAGPMLADMNPMEAIRRQVEATGADPEALTAAAMNAMRDLVMADEAGADQARRAAAQALAEARGIPLPQAEQQVAQMEQQYREGVSSAQQTAVRTADTAAAELSR